MNRSRRLQCIALAIAVPGAPAVPLVRIAAQSPSSITLATTDPCHKRPSGRVNLSAPAPAGYSVNLSSSAPAVVSVPTKVEAAAGAMFADFQLTCTASTQSVTATITASSLSGKATATASLTLLAPVLNAFTVQPHDGGPTVQAQVVLAGAAPAGGLVVTLVENSTRISAPISITVPAGATNHSFTMPVNAVPQPTVAQVVATGLGVSRTVDVTIIPPVPATLGFNSVQEATVFTQARTLRSNEPSTGRITLSAPSPSFAFPVQLTSSNPELVSIPSTVNFQSNALTADFQQSIGSVSQPTTVTITATSGGVSRSATITIIPPVVASMKLTPSKVIGGQDAQGLVTLNGTAPSGGFLVQLVSSNTAKVLVPPTVRVPAGQREVTFPIATIGLEQTISVEISASQGATRIARVIELAPEGPTAVTIAPSQVTGGSMAQGKLDALLSTDDFVVSLSSDKPTIATAPSTIAFAAGVTQKNFVVPTNPVGQDVLVTFTATLLAKTRSTTTLSLTSQFKVVEPVFKRFATLVVKAPVVIALEFANAAVVGPGSTTGTVRISGPAPQGGSIVRVTTELDSKARVNGPADIVVPAGATSANFAVSSSPVTTTTTAYFTARTGNIIKVSSLDVRKP